MVNLADLIVWRKRRRPKERHEGREWTGLKESKQKEMWMLSVPEFQMASSGKWFLTGVFCPAPT